VSGITSDRPGRLGRSGWWRRHGAAVRQDELTATASTSLERSELERRGEAVEVVRPEQDEAVVVA
jgi:hypothetical protein